MKSRNLIATFLFLPTLVFAQADLDYVIKGGELILSGLTILKVAKSDNKSDSKTIKSLCVKNKLTEKITFRVMGKNAEGDDIKKELVIPKDGKECLLELLKGIYTYEIELPNRELYKKGEYKFEEEIIITVKEE